MKGLCEKICGLKDEYDVENYWFCLDRQRESVS
jgi:hypothetical protein